jgi:hypothetical protein
MIISNPRSGAHEEFDNIEDEIKNFDSKSALLSANNGLANIFEIIDMGGKFFGKRRCIGARNRDFST